MIVIKNENKEYVMKHVLTIDDLLPSLKQISNKN